MKSATKKVFKVRNIRGGKSYWSFDPSIGNNKQIASQLHGVRKPRWAPKEAYFLGGAAKKNSNFQS